MKRHSLMRIICILLISLFILTGCKIKSPVAVKKSQIIIAEQFGLAYAPLQIMKKEGILEKHLLGVEIGWKQVENTAAIREAMLANKVDIGFMAIPPFLIGWDKGMEWKIASGLSSMAVGLVTYKEDIRSIRDFTDKDRIALPQPGSVQHILLSMAAEREFDNSHRFDNQIVTMSHPDGMNAILGKKDITGHFTSPPYLFKELEAEGMKQILDGREAFGKDFTFIVGVTTKEFHDKKPKEYQAFVKALEESISFINDNPEKSADLLAEDYGLSKEETLKYLRAKGTEYSEIVKGLHEFADFMERNDYISKNFEEIDEILWEDVPYER